MEKNIDLSKIKVSSAALYKANELLRHKAELDTCIRANICPICGNQLETEYTRDYYIVSCNSKPRGFTDTQHFNMRREYNTTIIYKGQ